jgi:hypothetical protein
MDERDMTVSDWNDVDLLTRDEAARRLSHEIELIVDRQTHPDTSDPAETERLDRRLAALRRSLAALSKE